ncbi:MAG TPA: DUF4173 domain-containing protein [Candidatus Limnocylindrales bacterium]
MTSTSTGTTESTTESSQEESAKQALEVKAEPVPVPQQTNVTAAQWDPLPPPPPGFIATRWPGPDYGGGPAAWISAVVGGAATAIALPLTRPGLGWFVVGLVCAIAVGNAARFGPRPDSQAERVVRIGWAVLALALLAVGIFLNAYWLHYICVAAALGCAALACAGGHSVRAIFYASFAGVGAFFRSIPWLARGATSWNKTREKQSHASRTAVAVLVTIVLLVVFGALFASADAAFARIIGDLLPEFSGRTMARIVFYGLVGGLLTAGATFIVLAPPDLSGLESPAKRRIGTVELVLPIGGLVLLFAGFVAVQARFLFSGNPPEGSTFSKYAVQGFSQLVVVTLLTLVVIGCVTRWAPKQTERDRAILRILLGVLVALTMVIVASAVYRMWLYMNELGWTRERFFFGAVEIYLGFVFLLIVAAGIKLRAAWFPRAIIASFALMLLAMAAFNPERYIAEQNINRFYDNRAEPGYLKTFDLGYLQFLTTDAINELVDLPEPYRSCALLRIEADLKNMPEQWYSWNVSRAHARNVIAETQIDPNGCTKWFDIRRENASR